MNKRGRMCHPRRCIGGFKAPQAMQTNADVCVIHVDVLAESKKGGRVMVILVVDDTSILRNVLRDILVEFCDVSKNDIFEASDGFMGVSEYKRLRPDLVFLDISMPGLSGIEAVKQIMQIDKFAKIVMCTGAGERATVKECMRIGAMDYLVKPLQPLRVAESVKKVMGSGYVPVKINPTKKAAVEPVSIVPETLPDPVKIGGGRDDSQ